MAFFGDSLRETNRTVLASVSFLVRVVVDSRFVHGYETAQKFAHIAIEQRQTLLVTGPRLWSMVSKRRIQLAESFLILTLK